MQHIVDPVPSLPTLDDLVPQMVEQLPDILLFFAADNPVPRWSFSGDLQGFPPGQSSSKRTANKIADIPVPCGGPQDFPETLHRAGVSSALPDEANQWFFKTFPRSKNSAKIPRTQGSELGAQSSS